MASHRLVIFFIILLQPSTLMCHPVLKRGERFVGHDRENPIVSHVSTKILLAAIHFLLDFISALHSTMSFPVDNNNPFFWFRSFWL